MVTVEMCVYRMCYTLEELRQHPLPNEVDPTQMETYLTNNDFLVCELLKPLKCLFS